MEHLAQGQLLTHSTLCWQ